MLVYVVLGKGAKDRYTVLLTFAYERLKFYIEAYDPEIWLFPGGNGEGHVIENSLQKIQSPLDRIIGNLKKE